jgi:hypothetical protein
MPKTYPLVETETPLDAPQAHPLRELPRREVAAPSDAFGAFSPFFSFHFSRTEVTSFGGRTHVKSRSTSFDGAKLAHESFDGELDRDAYDRLVEQAQAQVAAQVSWLMQPFTWLLGGKRRD